MNETLWGTRLGRAQASILPLTLLRKALGLRNRRIRSHVLGINRCRPTGRGVVGKVWGGVRSSKTSNGAKEKID